MEKSPSELVALVDAPLDENNEVIFANPDGTNAAADIANAMDELANNGQPNLIDTNAKNDGDKGS